MALDTWSVWKSTQTQVDKQCGRLFKEAGCEMMENKSIG